MAIYNHIGKTYDATRHADPEIAEYLYKYLLSEEDGGYLEIGCGSGNYTNALTLKGLNMVGIDISREMLIKAKHKNPKISWVLGDARQLPFKNKVYSGSVCVLATHHIGDLGLAFKEVYRVIERGRFVIFTSTPAQMQHSWLRHYFPKMMTNSSKLMQSFFALKKQLKQAGFTEIFAKPFFVTNTLQDYFLQAGKYRPQIYLDPVVRSGMSAFAKYSKKREEESGIKKLEQDISSGQINQVIESYESDKGDSLFVVAEKL